MAACGRVHLGSTGGQTMSRPHVFQFSGFPSPERRRRRTRCRPRTVMRLIGRSRRGQEAGRFTYANARCYWVRKVVRVCHPRRIQSGRSQHQPPKAPRCWGRLSLRCRIGNLRPLGTAAVPGRNAGGRPGRKVLKRPPTRANPSRPGGVPGAQKIRAVARRATAPTSCCPSQQDFQIVPAKPGGRVRNPSP